MTLDMIHCLSIKAWADDISLTCRNALHGLLIMQHVHEARCACSQIHITKPNVMTQLCESALLASAWLASVCWPVHQQHE